MRKVKADINIGDVILRIQSHTFYNGEARKEMGTPIGVAAKMQASDDDNTQLHDHIEVACSELLNIISRHFSSCTLKKKTDVENEANEIASYMFEIPVNYPVEVLSEVKKEMTNYIVMRSTQLWFMQCKPDEAALPANEAISAIRSLDEMMAIRKRPVKEIQRENNRIDI